MNIDLYRINYNVISIILIDNHKIIIAVENFWNMMYDIMNELIGISN